MLIGYPGAKNKLRKVIVPRLLAHLEECPGAEYREPFFGGGSIGLLVAPHAPSLWLNDKDPAVSSLWSAVIRSPDLLRRWVANFSPTQQECDRFAAHLLLQPPPSSRASDEETAAYGFLELAVRRCSFSMLGVKANTPHYYADRWNPSLVLREIDRIHHLLAGRVRGDRCTRLDFGSRHRCRRNHSRSLLPSHSTPSRQVLNSTLDTFRNLN